MLKQNVSFLTVVFCCEMIMMFFFRASRALITLCTTVDEDGGHQKQLLGKDG